MVPLPVTLAVLAAVILLYAACRNAWIAWQLARHGTLAAYWARRTRAGAVVLDEAVTIWPYHSVLLHPSWKWRSFVVYPGLYDEVMAYATTEAARGDLTWETYVAEAEADAMAHAAEAESDAAQVAEPASAVAEAPRLTLPVPPDDVTRN